MGPCWAGRQGRQSFCVGCVGANTATPWGRRRKPTGCPRVRPFLEYFQRRGSPGSRLPRRVPLAARPSKYEQPTSHPETLPEKLDAKPGYKVKDKLENKLHRLVCVGKTTLRTVQRRIPTGRRSTRPCSASRRGKRGRATDTVGRPANGRRGPAAGGPDNFEVRSPAPPVLRTGRTAAIRGKMVCASGERARNRPLSICGVSPGMAFHALVRYCRARGRP